jgi:hypothetical protein
MYESLMEIAMKNSENLGRCIGAMGFVLKYGELSNSDFRSLATTYIQVVGDNEFNKMDVDDIRAEASRRGVDIE